MRSIIKLLEETKSNLPPERIDQLEAYRVRVTKAVETFEKNFKDNGIPKTFKGTVLSIWYNHDLPFSRYFSLLHKVTKVALVVIRWKDKITGVFEKSNRK